MKIIINWFFKTSQNWEIKHCWFITNSYVLAKNQTWKKRNPGMLIFFSSLNGLLCVYTILYDKVLIYIKWGTSSMMSEILFKKSIFLGCNEHKKNRGYEYDIGKLDACPPTRGRQYSRALLGVCDKNDTRIIDTMITLLSYLHEDTPHGIFTSLSIYKIISMS